MIGHSWSLSDYRWGRYGQSESLSHWIYIGIILKRFGALFRFQFECNIAPGLALRRLGPELGYEFPSKALHRALCGAGPFRHARCNNVGRGCMAGLSFVTREKPQHLHQGLIVIEASGPERAPSARLLGCHSIWCRL